MQERMRVSSGCHQQLSGAAAGMRRAKQQLQQQQQQTMQPAADKRLHGQRERKNISS